VVPVLATFGTGYFPLSILHCMGNQTAINAPTFVGPPDLIIPSRSCHIPLMGWHAEVPAIVANFKNFLKKRGKSPEDAEDLIQEAFLRLERYCQTGNQVECPEAFLRRTVMNLSASDHRRAENRYVNRDASVESEPICDSAPTPDEVFAAEQRLKQLETILDRVGRRAREVYFMHRLGGFSYADIAERFNCSVSLIEKDIASAQAAVTYERCHGQLKEK
jgi:RNA polymerase sigma-70 factor (ECF subfamily)